MKSTSVRFLSVFGLCGVCLLALGCAPRSFVRSAPGWKVIELRSGLANNYEDAWQTSVDTVARNWDIEILDKDSGYLRTSWVYGISGGIYYRYRGRLTIKFPDVKGAAKVDVKTDAEWLEDPGYGVWLKGFDSSFQRDVFGELSGRLGRTVPSD
jgi:hypothetical protein